MYLGVVTKDSIQKETMDQFKTEFYQTIPVELEKELTQIEGVVIVINSRDQLPWAVSWINKCQKIRSLFVWIFSTIDLEHEHGILMEIGANEVVYGNDRSNHLILLVKNTFSHLEGDQDMEILNPYNQSIRINGYEQPLTQKEYKLFGLLYQYKGTCVTYEKILDTLWNKRQDDDLYRIANTVFHLRKKIQGSNQFIIQSVRAKGYILTEITEQD